jgi:hypothetical protein
VNIVRNAPRSVDRVELRSSRRTFLQFIVHGCARQDSCLGLKRAATPLAETTTLLAPLAIEHQYRSVAPHTPLAEHLDRVLQFVPDGCHEIAVRGARVN